MERPSKSKAAPTEFSDKLSRHFGVPTGFNSRRESTREVEFEA